MMDAPKKDGMDHVAVVLGGPAPQPKEDVDQDLDTGETPGGHEDYEMPEGFMEAASDLHTMAQSKGGKRGFAQALYNLMCKFRDEG